MKKILITGSRGFNDYEHLARVLDSFIEYDDIIVSGGARGADKLAIKYAKKNNLKYKVFYADWGNLNVPNCSKRINSRGEKYNALAGYNRNQEMLNYIKDNKKNIVCAFWDGSSYGTRDMIEISRKAGLKVKIEYM